MRHLDIYFQSLGIPYRAFEAADAPALARAIEEINRSESEPIRYTEFASRHDWSYTLLLLAVFGLALIAAAKLSEVQLGGRALP